MTGKYNKRIFRILETITLLESSHKKWQAPDLADHFGVSRRTFHRDRMIMEQVGIPIYYHPEEKSYKIKETFKFSPPELTKKEAAALAIIVRGFNNDNFPYFRELENVLAKLINALPSSLRKIIKGLDERVVLDQKMDVNLSSHLGTIRKIEEALTNNKRIEIDYYSLSKDRHNTRKIDPYRLAYKEGAGYLVGFCHLRNEKRMFRIDRINEIKLLRETFDRPEDFSLEEYFDDTWGVERGKKRKIEIIFSGFAARFVTGGDWHDSQEIEELDDDKIKFIVETGSYQEIKRWILSFGGEAEIVAPNELRDEIIEEIKEMRKLY